MSTLAQFLHLSKLWGKTLSFTTDGRSIHPCSEQWAQGWSLCALNGFILILIWDKQTWSTVWPPDSYVVCPVAECLKSCKDIDGL